MWYRAGKTVRVFIPKSEYERSKRGGEDAAGADSIESARRASRGEVIYSVDLPEECVSHELKSYAPVPGAGYHLQVPSERVSAAVDDRAKVTAAYPSYNDMLYNYDLERISPESERRVAGIAWMLHRVSRDLQDGIGGLMTEREEDVAVSWRELIDSAMHGTDLKQSRRERLAGDVNDGLHRARNSALEMERCASMLGEHRHEHDAADMAAAEVMRAAAVLRKYDGGDGRLVALAAAYASEALEKARAHLADFRSQQYTGPGNDPETEALLGSIRAEEERNKKLAIAAHRQREKNKKTVANIISNREKGYMYATQDDMHERRVKAGETDEIRFPSIPSAGYRWSMFETCEKMASHVEADFEPNDVKLASGETPIGGGGHEVFRIRFDEPGTYEMKFRYGRPREGASKTESIRYTVE